MDDAGLDYAFDDTLRVGVLRRMWEANTMTATSRHANVMVNWNQMGHHCVALEQRIRRATYSHIRVGTSGN